MIGGQVAAECELSVDHSDYGPVRALCEHVVSPAHAHNQARKVNSAREFDSLNKNLDSGDSTHDTAKTLGKSTAFFRGGPRFL
jgi:hypothetical protein